MNITKIVSLSAVSLLAACATTAPSGERGPDGTQAYHIEVEASAPGVRIEVNEDYIGNAPVSIKVYGDQDGTFHNFGSFEYVIKAIPANTNLFTQTKIFRTGGWFSQEDQIPGRIYFDMSKPSDIGGSARPRY